MPKYYYCGLLPIGLYCNSNISFVHIRSITSNIKFQITDLYRFDSHTLLAANRWVGALLIDIRTGHTRDVPFDCHDVVTMLPDSKGNFWVTPYCKGVQCYNKNGKLLHTYHTGNSSMQSNIVLALAEYDGHIWIGTDGKGIAVLILKTIKWMY